MLAVSPGRPLTNIGAIAWLTPGVIIVWRAPTGTEQTIVPELHLADDFSARPTVMEALMPRPHYVVQSGPLLAAADPEGQMMLLRVTESSR